MCGVCVCVLICGVCINMWCVCVYVTCTYVCLCAGVKLVVMNMSQQTDSMDLLGG